MTHLKHALIALALATCATSRAQMPPPPPPPDDAVPPAAVLATAPELSAAQQAQIRQILIQRRDADEQIHQKARAEIEALHTRERAEHEKADAQASDALRKLLGDEGYRRFAEWQLAHRGPRGMGPHGAPPHGHPGMPPDAPPPHAAGAAAAPRPAESDE